MGLSEYIEFLYGDFINFIDKIWVGSNEWSKLDFYVVLFLFETFFSILAGSYIFHGFCFELIYELCASKASFSMLNQFIAIDYWLF